MSHDLYAITLLHFILILFFILLSSIAKLYDISRFITLNKINLLISYNYLHFPSLWNGLIWLNVLWTPQILLLRLSPQLNCHTVIVTIR